MASADYRLCNLCSRKCFYDVTLDYDFTEYPDSGLFNVGAMVVLCRDCSKTNAVVIAKKDILEPPLRNSSDLAQ